MEPLAGIEPEHVVEAEEATRGVRRQVENLRKHQWGLAVIHEQLTNYKHNDTVVLGVRLTISANQLVLDLFERKRNKLVHNRLSALELLALEGQQGLLAVERAQRRSVRIESVVVVLNELATDRIELGIHDFK